MQNTWMTWGGRLTGLALGLLSVSAAWAFEPPVEVRTQAAEAPVKVSDYWIGLECFPVHEALRAQLKLPAEQGLMVASLMPDGPAAKAGVKQYDVLLTANGKALGRVQDLIETVDAAKDQPVKLDLLRGGEPMTLEIKPAKRPEPTPGPGTDWEQMRKWIERMRPGEEGRPPMRFRFFHPGTILPPEAGTAGPMPENMSIVIRKEGREPAKIIVTRGNEKWEVSENELDKLPADVRPHAERMLGHDPQARDGRFQFFDFVPDWTPSTPAGPEAQAAPAAPSEGRLEKRLESLERRLDQMRKSVDEMRANRPRLRDRQEKLEKEKPPVPETQPEAKS
jgi:hypothetical protein